MATKPVAEHEWLKNLVGEWDVETVMTMPDGSTATSKGHESVVDFGGMWAYVTGAMHMPDGEPMDYHMALGYDVSFKEYRGCWFATASSHLWRYVGELSDDKKTMTLNCEGPDMVNDGQTANYRDVIELLDANHRTLTSFGEQADGSWVQFMKATLTRQA